MNSRIAVNRKTFEFVTVSYYLSQLQLVGLVSNLGMWQCPQDVRVNTLPGCKAVISLAATESRHVSGRNVIAEVRNKFLFVDSISYYIVSIILDPAAHGKGQHRQKRLNS